MSLDASLKEKTMRVERDDCETRMRAEVFPFEGMGVSVIVERCREFGSGKWQEAEIRWSALRPQDADTTRRYAEAMLEACRIADEMSAVA